MHERQRAIAVLRQAREILIRRLTERILETEEELLDDAHGLTYCGEIDTIYEQVAVRLNHVNAMLANLPAEETEPWAGGGEDTSDGGDFTVPYSHSPVTHHPFLQEDTSQPSLAADTLTSPHEATVLPSVVTFELFARQVLCEDVESAGRSLAVLFAVDAALGRRCALEFHVRLSQRPELMTRLLHLRRALQEGSINEPLTLLAECFGLEGLESLSVLQTLRARLIGHNEAA